MIVGRDGAVPSLRAAPYPVAARRRAVTVLVTPLHVDEPAPAALVGVELFFFFSYAAALSRGLQRYLGAVFFFLLAMSCPRPRSITASWSSDGARNCSALAATVVRNS